MSEDAVPGRVLRTAVAFDDLRLAYIPVPKAASTSILHALGSLAGLDEAGLRSSRKPEATRGLAVHDGSMWPRSHRFLDRDPAEVDDLLRSDNWFVFTVVREPTRRIWSAWVSKVLVRDPRFVLMFGEEFFPPRPSTASDVVGSFRRFVQTASSDPAWADDHWSPQYELLGTGFPYTHVGRLENLDRTSRLLSEHLLEWGAFLPPFRVENRSLLPFSPSLFDGETHEACVAWTARDREMFGYDAPAGPSDSRVDDDWLASVEASLPSLDALIDRNERILDLWRLLSDEGEHAGDLSRPARLLEGRVSHRTRLALAIGAGAIAIAILLTLVPEALHDWPYNALGH